MLTLNPLGAALPATLPGPAPTRLQVSRCEPVGVIAQAAGLTELPVGVGARRPNLTQPAATGAGGTASIWRLLPVVRAAGYQSSARNLRRAVAKAKARWRQPHEMHVP